MPEKEYKYRATCHTKCYWKENLWKPGEVYEGDDEPIKHFNETGISPEKPPPDAAGDPRSNVELREILKKKFNSTKPRTWTRKKLWAALKEFEDAAARDALTNPEPKKVARKK